MSKIIRVDGTAVPVIGDDIDTDRIIPARYLKEITFSKMGDYPFFDERFNKDGSQKKHSFNDPKFKDAKILFANVNFGCGSSREHAPQALMRWGIEAIVAESFAEIFAGNCVMLGIPAVTTSKENMKHLQEIAERYPEADWTLDLINMTLQSVFVGGLISANQLQLVHFKVPIEMKMPDSRRKALLEGTWDSTGLLLDNAGKVAEKATKLAYMSNFS